MRAVGRYGGRAVKSLGLTVLLFTALPPYRLTAQCPDGSPPPCTANRAPRTAPANSVAVLYFDNLSRDTADQYIASGVTEELINRLGRIERLQVKSRTYVQRYRGRPIDDPAALARSLGVAHLVSGSVQRGGGRLRVTVELTRAPGGMRVWGDTYDRAADDLMAVESEVAEAIASAIGGRLAPAERQSLAARPTASSAAYDHLLRGRFLYARRSPDALRRAVAEFEGALRLDPDLAEAHASRALAYTTYLSWHYTWPGLPQDSLVARAQDEVARLLREPSPPPLARSADCLLLILQHPKAPSEGVACMEPIVASNPRNADVLHQFGFMQLSAGRDSAAVDAFGRALALDGARAITIEILSRVFLRTNRLAEALRWLDSAIVVDPGFAPAWYGRAAVRLARADTAGAVADVETSMGLSPSPVWGACILSRAGHRDRADEYARLAQQDPDVLRSPVFGPPWACYLDAVGRRDESFAALERIRPRGFELWGQLRAPWYDMWRADARFQRIIDDARPVGLP
jgi:TolB-like protein/Tfp pilus assembly protein PilF